MVRREGESKHIWRRPHRVLCTNLFLEVVDTIGEDGSVHTQLVVWLAITISVPVKAAVADVVFHAPVSVFHKLLHFNQVDCGSGSRTVASSDRKVLRAGFVPNTAGGLSLGVGQRR